MRDTRPGGTLEKGRFFETDLRFRTGVYKLVSSMVVQDTPGPFRRYGVIPTDDRLGFLPRVSKVLCPVETQGKVHVQDVRYQDKAGN